MRLIDADALKSSIVKLKESPWFNTKAGYAYRKEAIEFVETLCVDKEPTVDPIRHGEWIGTELDGYFVSLVLKCSVCGCLVEDDEPTWNYCPNCGARMDGGEEYGKND